jgi:hypothetical protein
MVMSVMMLMAVSMTVLGLSVRGCGRRILFRPELFPRQIFFVVHPHIGLGRRNSAAHDSRNLQPRAYAQRRHGIFQHLRRNSGIDERAQEHVAAYAGKTLKICNAHKIQIVTTEDTENHRGIERKRDSATSASSVVKGLAATNDGTFIIGKRAIAVKRAPAARSDKITVSSIA